MSPYTGCRSLLLILLRSQATIGTLAFNSAKAHSIESCVSYSKVRHEPGSSHSGYATANNETEMRPKDPDYLPSGFYDAVENPISENEYWRQIDFEQKSGGVPYHRDRAAERQRLSLPLSISTFDTRECQGERKQHVIERGICYKTTGGRSYRIDSLPSDGEVITYVDGECREDPFACNWGISNPGGCFTTDDFESLVVVTRELPA
ncbi:hypothetical protein KC315_g10733 [Hortaea werneckii]|nr:hypothetical protein KC315_g10733 [Hortaea werneckii]KAI7350858.1 hypothetical protein KC354_g12644 [Hortaea werneckii]